MEFPCVTVRYAGPGRIKKSGGYRSFDKERMEKICRELKGKQLTVTEVKESKSSVPSRGWAT